MYMLDTNICIYVLKSHSENLWRIVLRHRERRQFAPTSQVETVGHVHREAFHCPLGKDAAREYGMIRARLKQQGNLIGNNDILIAAHARSLISPW